MNCLAAIIRSLRDAEDMSGYGVGVKERQLVPTVHTLTALLSAHLRLTQ